MSRNFENEYRNFMADEVPDLWSRIEGNLKEKEPVVGDMAKEVATNQKQKIKEQKYLNERNKKIASIYVKKYAVAACLCVVILVGGIAVYKSNVQRVNDTSRVIDMEATKDSMDYDMSEGVAPMEENEMVAPEMDDAGMDDAGMDNAEMDESAMMESEIVFDKTYDESSLEEQLNQIMASGDEVESEIMEETSEELSESNRANIQALVKIISIEDTGEEILYYVQVLPSVYSVFEPGTELVLCSGDLVISEPEMGVAYKVTLEQLLETQTIQNETIYMIKAMEQQVE